MGPTAATNSTTRAAPRHARNARTHADRPAADLLRCLRGSGVARPRGTGEVVAPHALETAAESSRSREEAAQREASGAVVERPQQRAWVVLSTVPVVVGDKDSRAVKILPGTDLLLDLQDPPRLTHTHPQPSDAATKPSARLLLTANQDGTCEFDLHRFA